MKNVSSVSWQCTGILWPTGMVWTDIVNATGSTAFVSS